MSSLPRPSARISDALWERYRESGDPEARSQLLDSYLGLVHHAARELIGKVSLDVELDDLLSAGTVGLVQALEGFEPARGLAFSTYAMPRIRGAMRDELRGRDWMTRGSRQRARRIAIARAELAQTLGREPAHVEVAERIGITIEEYWRWHQQTDGRVVLALDHAPGEGDEGLRLSETIADQQSAQPGDALTHAEMLAELREAVGQLPEKERLVLSLYYYEGLNLREIGEVLHLTESRVSQIRSVALRRLREWVDRQEAS